MFKYVPPKNTPTNRKSGSLPPPVESFGEGVEHFHNLGISLVWTKHRVKELHPHDCQTPKASSSALTTKERFGFRRSDGVTQPGGTAEAQNMNS